MVQETGELLTATRGQPEPDPWIGPGTWLVDRAPTRYRIGVITDVYERDEPMASRLSIRWKPNSYENTSVHLALKRFRSGRWVVNNE